MDEHSDLTDSGWTVDRSGEDRDTLLWRVRALESILGALEREDYRTLSEVAEDYQAQVDAVVGRMRAPKVKR